MTTTTREFLNMLLKTDLKEDSILNMTKYIKDERQRLNDMRTTATAGQQYTAAQQHDYKRETDLLNMEEHILVLLFKY
ncbi:unnamed protein product [Adineta steineri]|uniref:Uncharacterized protein n=1 Tax=Adineta steineri TaxID=433720 RepID=A0A815BSZ3_9BILA|nr:unnamed protein product [Adineta steineri]CAF4095614.1 unnamed protein product [Adineta steineri]